MTETLNPTNAPQWNNWVGQYNAVSQQFAKTYDDLKKLGPFIQQHPEYASQYNSLLAQGAQHQATLATLNSVKNAVVPWLNQIVTAAPATTILGPIGVPIDASNAIINWFRSTFHLGEMGAVPVVVVGVGIVAAAAALTLIVKWITDTVQLMQRLNAQQALIAQGVSPAQAAQIVQQNSATSLFGIPWNTVILAGVVVLLAPKLLDMINGDD